MGYVRNLKNETEVLAIDIGCTMLPTKIIPTHDDYNRQSATKFTDILQ